MAIDFKKKIFLKNPYFIATWPGMGYVASGVGMYLLKKINFQLFAEIDSDKYFRVSDVIVKDGILSLPKLPKNSFYYAKNVNRKDLILFFGEAQPSLEYELIFAREVIKIAELYDTRMIFTAAAAPINISHKDTPDVWGVGTSEKMLELLKSFKIEIMTEGHIGGLNGLFLGVAKEKKIPGICILGEIPIYMVEMENPKASKSILKFLSQILDIQIDFEELDNKIVEFEEKTDNLLDEFTKRTQESIEKLPDLFKNIFSPQSKLDASKILKEIKFGLPESAKGKIEQLFEEAKKDISKADVLKKELDKWSVYKDYEDRFLDLFKKEEDKNK